MNKKVITSLAVLILGLAAFILTIKYIGFQEILHQFSTIKPQFVLLYLTVSIMIVVVLIVKWSVILRAFGHKVSFLTLFMYSRMGYAVGYVVPAFYIGGETVRAYFLNKKHDIPLTDAVSSVVIDRAVELPMNFLLAAIMFFLIIFTIKLPLYILIPMGIVILFMIVLCTLFYYKMYKKEYFFTHLFDILKLEKIKRLAGFREKIIKLEDTLIGFFNHKAKYVIISLGISLLLWLLMMLEFWTGLRIVGYPSNFVQIFLIIVMIGFTMTIPIPASIGIMELGQIGICVMMGIPAAVAVALSLLVRTRDLMWILTGLGYYLYSGTDYMKMVLKDMQISAAKHNDK
jgi:uncharacterized protein (TIRG00374 family)